ncbi:lipopolysaccharide biosynthesis protein [Candidatus Saccharibacteria bacterium]|nr:lipopolysaccharide biosynthesis protein [Candidatus Saccharibacteria bacterium]
MAAADTKNLKQKTISGLFWRFGERITAQLISFIVSIILARILLPEQYGTIACVTIFITLANVFVTSGLGTSLVQKKNADELDFSTMFWSSLLISIVLYIILFCAAPLISYLYHDELLTPVIRIMSLKLPIAAISSIQQAYVTNRMIFKKFFFSTLFGTLLSAVVGITLAYNGFGVWALVAQYLTNSITDTIVLFFTIDWKPKLIYSKQRFKKLFGYGWKIMASSFVGTFFDQLRGLIIGLRYTSSDLAYNNKGEQIPSIISNNLNVTLDTVLFSSISKLQDDQEAVKRLLRKATKMGAYLLCPLLLGLASVSETLIRVLLTDKWLPCVPYLQIICFQHVFSILNTINMQAIKAVGRSDIILKLEFIKKPIYLTMILCAIPFGPLAICAANAIYGIVALVINTRHNKKLFNYTLREQLGDIIGYIILAIIMAIIVFFLGKLNLNIYILLILQIACGGILYLILSIAFRAEPFKQLIDAGKSYLKQFKKRKETR